MRCNQPSQGGCPRCSSSSQRGRTRVPVSCSVDSMAKRLGFDCISVDLSVAALISRTIEQDMLVPAYVRIHVSISWKLVCQNAKAMASNELYKQDVMKRAAWHECHMKEFT